MIRFHQSWEKLLHRYGNKEWEIDKLVKDITELKNNGTGKPIHK